MFELQQVRVNYVCNDRGVDFITEWYYIDYRKDHYPYTLELESMTIRDRGNNLTTYGLQKEQEKIQEIIKEILAFERKDETGILEKVKKQLREKRLRMIVNGGEAE